MDKDGLRLFNIRERDAQLFCHIHKILGRILAGTVVEQAGKGGFVFVNAVMTGKHKGCFTDGHTMFKALWLKALAKLFFHLRKIHDWLAPYLN